MSELSHLDAAGNPRMVEVGGKPETSREARARATVRMRPETLERLANAPKGDVLAVARLAGLMGAKRTPELIPLCHPLSLTGIELEARAVPP
ncbi:MAG: cyclic pyranopterin monophosphate synthase MoaC, partial [Candidatus Eremiobacterota bacterium]